MDCYSGFGLLLLAIIAALFFILKSKTENGSAMLRWIAWATILIAFISIGCMLRNCLHSGCCSGEGGYENMSSCHGGDDMMREEECHHGHHGGKMTKAFCCEGDSMDKEKVFVDDDGDTIRVEKTIKVITEEGEKK